MAKLFNEFPPITTQEWENIINKDLKGADYDKKLIWKTLEGFNVQPYYRSENLEKLNYLTKGQPNNFPYVRATKDVNDWKIRVDIKVNNIHEANNFAKKNINNGVTSIGFVFCKEITEDAFEKLLEGIDIEKVEINFIDCSVSYKYVNFLIDYAKKHNVDLTKIYGSNEYDPLAYLVLTGTTLCGENQCECMQNMLKNLQETMPNFRILTANPQIFNNAGSNVVEELAFGLAMGAEKLDKLTDFGLTIDEIAPKMQFNFAIGSNYFMEIAKLRAARFLWAKIVEAYKPKNIENTKIKIHSETSRWNKTVYDPYVNMLRVTTEAMSAILGATDSLTVLPFDIAFNEGTEFSERIAKNVQLIIKEEAHFGKIIDPAAGSYYIENLTNSLVDSAWNLFLEVQDKGGFFEAFKSGFIQDKIEATAKTRDKNIAIRKEILLGTNQYPNFTEVIKNLPKLENCCDYDCSEQKIARPIKMYRVSEEFEKMRLTIDSKTKRPLAFMLTIGNLNMRKARAQFACNFFACAGFEVVDNNGFETITEGLKEAENKKADIIVLCSSDEEYENFALELKEKIASATLNHNIIVIAGSPECRAKLEENGITNFISIKSNVLEELKKYAESV